MKTHFNTVQALEAGILEQANREIREMMAEAEVKARHIRQTNQAEVAKLQQTIIQRAQQEADSLLEHAVSAAQMEAQTLKLQRREQIIATVFDTARQQLPNIATHSNYASIAYHLLREAVLGLRVDHLIVHADPIAQTHLDADVLTELGLELDCRLERGAKLNAGTGVLVETRDGRRRYDNTLETRLERMRHSLRAPVYQRLMGGEH